MFTLSCESTVDLPKQHLLGRGISVIQYQYVVENDNFTDDNGETKEALSNLYAMLEQNKHPTTSQLNEQAYLDYFRPLLQKGNALHVAFGSGMSQSVAQAYKAQQTLAKEYPHRKLYVVDSTCSCVGYGLFVDTLADMRDKGFSLEQIYSWAQNNRHKVHHQFFTTTLTHFRRSGRVSGPAAFLGNLLKLCPIMRLNYDGKIIAYNKVMSVSKAIKTTLDEVARHVNGGDNYDGKMWISHSNCLDTAQIVKQELQRLCPNADVRLFDIGPIIACHCGPGTVAVYFWGDTRTPSPEQQTATSCATSVVKKLN